MIRKIKGKMLKKFTHLAILAIAITSTSFLAKQSHSAELPFEKMPEKKKYDGLEPVIEVNDWKEPPKDIPWSKIVTIGHLEKS